MTSCRIIFPRFLLVQLVLITASITQAAQYADFTYEISNGSVTITRYTGSASSVSIPNEIDGLPVKSIGLNAFWNIQSLIAISVPDSVTTIAPYAFSGCKNLSNISISKNVINLQEGLFYGCTSLTEFEINSNIQTIGDSTFGVCTNLNSITIPESVVSIGSSAFYGCSNLINITIPKSVTAIYSSAFAYCTKLKSVTIGPSVDNILGYAFDNCRSLENVYFYGNAPTNVGLPIFNNTYAKIYYLPGKTGWNDTFAGKVTYLLTPISITVQPTNTTANRGDSINLTVATTGYFPTYQWRKNTIDIAGATSSTLNLNNIQTWDEGSYTVTVTNMAGSVTSNAATLTVNTPPPPPPVVTAPSIISHPSGLSVTAGASATFSVSVNGTSPSYQWHKNGSPISGATASSYTIPSAQASDAGNYTVTVFNTAGSVTSNAATLTVGPPPPSITSDLSTVSVPKKKLIPRFAITTNFSAKSFIAKGLPKGLKLNAKNGVISGKPTKPGTYTVTLTARKMKGKKVEQQATATKVVIVY